MIRNRRIDGYLIVKTCCHRLNCIYITLGSNYYNYITLNITKYIISTKIGCILSLVNKDKKAATIKLLLY
jgi:hypothetical protein